MNSVECGPDEPSRINNWLKLKLSKIMDRCSLNEKEFINATIDRYERNYLNFLTPSKMIYDLKSNYYFYHFYNPILVESMKELINTIQHYLNDTDRLTHDDQLEILQKNLNAHAEKVNQSELFSII